MNTPEYHAHSLHFHGSGKEYFKIWITNLLLTIITLGIYSAWAKVRTKRYFYGNTVLDNSAFEYHGNPIAILKGKLLSWFMLAISIALTQFFPTASFLILFVVASVVGPWVICKSLSFNAKVSSYRNVHFGFDGGTKTLYFYFVAIPSAILLTTAVLIWLFTDNDEMTLQQWAQHLTIGFAAIYLIFPYLQAKMAEYYFNHHLFGLSRFSAKIETWFYYKIYLKLILILLPIFAIMVFGLIGVVKLIQVSGNPADLNQYSTQIIAFVFVALLFNIFVRAFFVARVRNYTIGRLELEPNMVFSSNLRVMKLMSLYFTNLLLIIVTFGFAYPWAKIRLTHYLLQTIHLEGALSTHVDNQRSSQSALGEELGDAFDIDLDIGL